MIDLSKVRNFYVVCGYTDLRFGIDGLAAVVTQQFGGHLDVESLFLFCGRRTDRIKALYWSGYGYILLYQHMKQRLPEQTVIHADETVVHVLKEDGKPANPESRMWVYGSGERSTIPIRIFECQPDRSGKRPESFLRGFTGKLVTDGYAGYNLVAKVTLFGCWTHTKHKWREAMPKGNGPRRKRLSRWVVVKRLQNPGRTSLSCPDGERTHFAGYCLSDCCGHSLKLSSKKHRCDATTSLLEI